MHYSGPIVRPPHEANSVLLEVTVGCTHNRCRFCTFYRDVKFRIAPLEQIEADLREVVEFNPQAKRVYALGDRLKLHENEQDVNDRLLFNRKWLENISSNPKNVRIVLPNPSGTVDSIMLVDQGITGIYQGCRYLIEINGHYSLNHVSMRPNNMLHLTVADGENNLDFEVSSSEVRIIGRLILAVNKM